MQIPNFGKEPMKGMEFIASLVTEWDPEIRQVHLTLKVRKSGANSQALLGTQVCPRPPQQAVPQGQQTV